MKELFFTFLAETPPPEQIPDPFHLPENIKELEPSSKFYSEFFYMLLMLGILVTLLYFLSWYMKRLLNSQVDKLNVNSEIKVIEKRALSNKSVLYLIEYNEQEFLLAESPTSITELKLK